MEKSKDKRSTSSRENKKDPETVDQAEHINDPLPPYESQDYGRTYVRMNRNPIIYTRFPEGDIVCFYCRNRCVATVVRDSYSSKTFIWSCLLCWFAGPFCAVIPFLLRDLKRTDHYCPHCHNVLGSFQETEPKTEIGLVLLLILGILFSAFTAWLVMHNRRCDPHNKDSIYC